MRENNRSSDEPDDRDNAVEFARDGKDVLVSDPKHPDGPTLRFSQQAWRAFLGSVSHGPDPAE